MTTTTLDEALERLAGSGPERRGWLSNHGPMACEVMTRHGHGAGVDGWLDSYADQLEDAPRGIEPIERDDWREPLGDPVRSGDWIRYFEREVALEDWREVVAQWWGRLLPGVAAGATHGVIRTGHALRCLREQETPERRRELAHALAYWAARWQPLAPPGRGPYGAGDPRAALDRLSRISSQHGGIRTRLAQLSATPDWAQDLEAPGDADRSPAARLEQLIDSALLRMFRHGHGNPVMMVHSVTAPNAVLQALPVLPSGLHDDSVRGAWAAAAAITAAYGTAAPDRSPSFPARGAADHDPSAADLMAAAVDTGDAHAIKLADSALDSLARTDDPTIPRALPVVVARIADDD